LQAKGSRFDPDHLHQICAGLAQLVERHVANVEVIGSNPISCSKFYAPIVYRLGHRPFTAGRGVRFSLGVPVMEVWQSPVYCNSLENCRSEMVREFESHRFRHVNGVLAERLKAPSC